MCNNNMYYFITVPDNQLLNIKGIHYRIEQEQVIPKKNLSTIAEECMTDAPNFQCSMIF